MLGSHPDLVDKNTVRHPGLVDVSQQKQQKPVIMSTVEELKLRVRELENELIRCRQKCSGAEQPVREKIHTMSSEVVDSNPYRYTPVWSQIPSPTITLPSGIRLRFLVLLWRSSLGFVYLRR